MKMIRKALAVTIAGTALLAGTASAQNKPIEIQMWMGLTGLGGETLTKYGEEFNKMQNEYKVVVSFKGQYPEQRAAAVAAFRAGNPPHIMQMFDAGSGDMMGASKAIVPVSEVFKRAGMQFNPGDFIAPARGYYGLKDGSLLSMPFNVSTSVLFYNKDVFKKAGLDANKPPATWPDLIAAAKKIRSTNAANCGFTTTWLAWIQLEQLGARQIDAERGGRGLAERKRIERAARRPEDEEAGGDEGVARAVDGGYRGPHQCDQPLRAGLEVVVGASGHRRESSCTTIKRRRRSRDEECDSLA